MSPVNAEPVTGFAITGNHQNLPDGYRAGPLITAADGPVVLLLPR